MGREGEGGLSQGTVTGQSQHYSKAKCCAGRGHELGLQMQLEAGSRPVSCFESPLPHSLTLGE